MIGNNTVNVDLKNENIRLPKKKKLLPILRNIVFF